MALQFPEVDDELVEKIVDRLKSQGIFDQFRKDCLADVDSRPAYQNLRDKVNGAVADFLSKQAWKDELNKNQVRESLRKHVQQHYLEVGVNKIVEQVVNPKIFSVFMPKVEDIVYQVMGIEKPTNAEDRSHNRLRFLMSNNIPQPSPGNVFSEILPSDLDPVSPGSINENANLNDSMNNKTIDEGDNTSHDLNKESNLDINEASNESKVSGISELSSHGSTTKLDISESAHLPGDKSGMNYDVISIQSNPGDADRSKGVNENVTSGFDFDNFSNLKEKLLKTDPLNKNLDKDKIDPSTTNKNSEVDSLQNEEFKPSKDTTSSENAEESKTEKVVKSPMSCLYSEDSIGSNCSLRSKMKTDKIHLMNESTRNSLVMDCEDSSVSFIDKKFEVIKEAESVSCIESLKEESQMSMASNDSRKFSNFANLKLNNENSQNRSIGSSPDLVKHISNDRKKEEVDRKGSSYSTQRSDRYDPKHKSSRNSSRDRKYSKDSKSKTESDKKYSSSSRDKCSSRSKDDRHRSDSKNEKKSNYDDSKRDSKHILNYDEKNRKDKEPKPKLEDENKIFSNIGKESQNSSDDDKKLKKSENKNSDKEKNSKSCPDKIPKDDNKSIIESKAVSKKEDVKRNTEDLKTCKANDSKVNSDDRKSSKDKTSEDDKHYKRDKDLKRDEYKSSRSKDKSTSKSSSDKESKSSPQERKSSSSRSSKDSKPSSEEERSSRKDKDVSDKSVKSSDIIEEEKRARNDVNDRSLFKNDKKQNFDKRGDGSDRKKGSNEAGLKKDDKDLKKRKRENCSEDMEKKGNRRSRDRDDGNHRNSGHSSSREHKDSDKRRKSGTSNQEKTISSSSKDNSSKEQVDSYSSNISTNEIDMILKRIDSSIQADTNNIVLENINESNPYNPSDTSPFDSKELKIDFNTSEKQLLNDIENSDKIQENRLEILKTNSKDKGSNDIQIHENSDNQIIRNSVNKENIISAHDTMFKKEEVKEADSTEMNLKNVVGIVTDNDLLEDEFLGFDQSSTGDTFKHAMSFKEFMIKVYCSESSSGDRFSDKYFSLTDNNLNNIDFKNDLTILMSKDRLCNATLIPNCPVDDDKSRTILSPVTKSLIYNLWSEPAEVPQDAVSQTGSPCRSKVTDLTSRTARENVEDSAGKTTDYSRISKDSGQTKRNEDAVSLSESWSSERGFTLPSVTEDMLDNFMMENIIDKLDGCYNSSDSEVESWNVPVTPDAILLTDEEPSNKKDESVPGVGEVPPKKSIEKTRGDGIPRSKEEKGSSPSKPKDVKKSSMCLKVDSKKVFSEDLTEEKKTPPSRAKESKKLASVRTKHEDKSSALHNNDDKTLPRVSQRYNDADLYKPRPLITNPSRRNRVTSKNGSKPTRGMKRMGDSLEFSENKRPR